MHVDDAAQELYRMIAESLYIRWSTLLAFGVYNSVQLQLVLDRGETNFCQIYSHSVIETFSDLIDSFIAS
jgi:hypothetical protein